MRLMSFHGTSGRKNPSKRLEKPIKQPSNRHSDLKLRIQFENYMDKTSPLMPCLFTGPKMFFASPNFLSQPKNLTTISASSKTFMPLQKPILLNANHLFVWHKMFVTATILK